MKTRAFDNPALSDIECAPSHQGHEVRDRDSIG